MFAAREFIIEWARLLLVGDTWAGRAVRWVSFLVFGLLAVFSERLHFLIWGPGWIRIWPLHGELGIGASLVLVIGIFYASITAGAAWTRTRRVQVMFRYPACDRCLVGNQVELEVWN